MIEQEEKEEKNLGFNLDSDLIPENSFIRSAINSVLIDMPTLNDNSTNKRSNQKNVSFDTNQNFDSSENV